MFSGVQGGPRKYNEIPQFVISQASDVVAVAGPGFDFSERHQLLVPMVRLSEFLPDTQQIGRGVVVGQGNWQQQLEDNKNAFTSEFVQRSRFAIAFATSMTPAGSDRTAAINEFGSATTTADAAARSRALRDVAENATLNQQGSTGPLCSCNSSGICGATRMTRPTETIRAMISG
jgi:hypothetical protein